LSDRIPSRLVVAACLLLAACGFQLRGEAPTGLNSLYISTEAPSSLVAVEVRRQLSGTPTRVAATAAEGEAHLRILSESTEKTIQTLTGAGRVFDYRLHLKVRFRVTDAAGKAIVEPAEIELWRIISYSETAPLAKEAEEQLLFSDMRAEAAARILRRIAVVRAGAAKP
jgi:LPS-assembly lipoprotein